MNEVMTKEEIQIRRIELNTSENLSAVLAPQWSLLRARSVILPRVRCIYFFTSPYVHVGHVKFSLDH
jgi:hypothetical protein